MQSHIDVLFVLSEFIFLRNTFSISEILVTEEARDIFYMGLSEKYDAVSHSYNNAEHHKDAP